MNNIIEVKDVCFSYDEKQVLKNINLTIKKGEYVTILGHNGSGKSTLVKLFNGLNLPSKGQVLIDGMDTKDQTKIWDIRKCCSMVFQNPDNQLVATSVEEDIAFGLENIGVPQEQMNERIEKALKAVSMEAFRKKEPHNLSGGQKQRIAIAGVLAMEPQIILFDESTAMLDPKGRKDVMDVIDVLNKQYGKTIIHVTHHMYQALYSDRAIVLSDGEVVLDDTPLNIFRNPKIKELALSLPPVIELMQKLEGVIDFGDEYTEEGVMEKICQLL